MVARSSEFTGANKEPNFIIKQGNYLKKEVLVGFETNEEQVMLCYVIKLCYVQVM